MFELLHGQRILGKLIKRAPLSDVVQWGAMVTDAPAGSEGSSKFQVWFLNKSGAVWIPGGQFNRGAALVKYLRREWESRYQGVVPDEDTLGALTSRVAGSVVPYCFQSGGGGGGRGRDGCAHCLYVTTCGTEQPGTFDPKIVDNSGWEERLKNKMAGMFDED